MDLLRSQPSLSLLQYAHGGFQLSEAEIRSLEAGGWARALPREVLPLLRRSRTLAWEVGQLEEQRRDRMPSSHPLAKLAEGLSAVRRRRECGLAALSGEIDRKTKERAGLHERLTPLMIQERDRLLAFRPVTTTHSLRLTEEGRKLLCGFRFSEAGSLAAGNRDAMDDRIQRFAEIYARLQTSQPWQERFKNPTGKKKDPEADSLWLAAVLSRLPGEPEAAVQQFQEGYARTARCLLWWQDPLPISMIALAGDTPCSFPRAMEVNRRLSELKIGAGYSLIAAGFGVAARAPAFDPSFLATKIHRFWKELVGYGLAFSDFLLPAAARLATVRRPVERTALLLRSLDNRTARFDRMNDYATRLAASYLAEINLDYRDRGDGVDLFSKDDPYHEGLIRRYGALWAAVANRCRFEASGEVMSPVLAGILAGCPGSIDSVIDRLDRTRRHLASTDIPSATKLISIPVLLMDSYYRREWEVNHSWAAFDLYRIFSNTYADSMRAFGSRTAQNRWR